MGDVFTQDSRKIHARIHTQVQRCFLTFLTKISKDSHLDSYQDSYQDSCQDSQQDSYQDSHQDSDQEGRQS